MEVPGRNFDVRYERDYGVHEFETHDGQPVTVISQPTWEDFIDSVSQGQFKHEGIVVSPELITSPYHLSMLPQRTSEVTSRTIQLQTLSTRYPEVTFLLGTATYKESGDNSLPSNSLVFIRDCIRIGMSSKRLLGPFEHGIFRSARNEDTTTLPGSSIGTLICADLITTVSRVYDKETRRPVAELPTEPSIDTKTRTLIVSSCWAIPFFDEGNGSDERFQKPLEECVSGVFDVYPNVQEVIVADRAIEISETTGPFNAHFTRKQD